MNQTESGLNAFESRLLESWPAERWRGVRIAIGVSGGPDSVALLRGMHVLTRRTTFAGESRLEVLHFNHQWRGDASADDEQFVAQLSDQLDLRCTVGRTDKLASPGASGEAAARQERYHFFRQTAEAHGARYLLTAHTRDDQVETVMHRIMRGTGIAGLAGIRPTRKLSQAVTVARPLLSHSRADVLEYLKHLGQSYQTDNSNQDTRFTRNRIRNDLLPMLAQQYNPSIIDALLKLSSFAAEAQALIGGLVDGHVRTCLLKRTADQIVFDVSALGTHSEFLQREIVASVWRELGWPEQGMGAEQWHRLTRLIAAEGPGIEFPGRIRAHRQGSALTLMHSRSAR